MYGFFKVDIYSSMANDKINGKDKVKTYCLFKFVSDLINGYHKDFGYISKVRGMEIKGAGRG